MIAQRPTPNAQRVVFVPFIDAFGGVERLVLAISRFLNRRGQQHSILCFRNTLDLARYANWPIAVNEVRAARNVLSEGLALRRTLPARRRDMMLAFDLKGALYAGFARRPFVVHLTDPPSLLGTDVTKYARAARRAYNEHIDTPAMSAPRRLRAEVAHRVTSAAVRRAEQVIVMTNAIAHEVKVLYGVDSLVLRPGVAEASPPKRHSAKARQPLRMLSVCRLEPSKRVAWILHALAALESAATPLSNRIDWGLDIVGDGSEFDSLRREAARLGLTRRVDFHGRVSDAVLEELYEAAALFLMPAVQGWGLPALESLQRGAPVVIHEQSGVTEILRDSPWVERIRDPAGSDFATAIERMVARLGDGTLTRHSPPVVPSDMEWAESVCRRCGWN